MIPSIFTHGFNNNFKLENEDNSTYFIVQFLGSTTFCQRKDLRPSVFSYWRKKYRQDHDCRSSSNVKVHKEGNYTLSAKTEERTEIQLNIEKGRDYFIRCGIYKASFLGKPKVHLVIEDFARLEFEACMERYETKKSKR